MTQNMTYRDLILEQMANKEREKEESRLAKKRQEFAEDERIKRENELLERRKQEEDARLKRKLEAMRNK